MGKPLRINQRRSSGKPEARRKAAVFAHQNGQCVSAISSGFLELSELLLPLGGLVRTVRGVVELHQALKGFLQTRSAVAGILASRCFMPS